jgi:phosphomannomutase
VIEYNRGEMHTDLLAAARRWIAADPDPDTRQEMQSLLDARDHAALEDRLGSALTFGTAGLRGVLGAGTNRMNLAVVLRTTVGLCRYLRAVDPAGAQRGVVVGYDGRRMSREFAEAAARVIAAEGLPCHLFDDLGPTPLVAYAVRALEAAAGVMVTASHNPPEYNGYKVYWGNGAQIIPPQDVGIAAAIDAAPPASELQLPSLDEARASGRVTAVPAALTTEYRDAVLALDPDPAGAPLRIVYTAMHGVGAALATDVLARRGEVFSVPAQHAPDGRFPTVRFPNPEEPGAMDLALALARETHADLVIANDPDADRLAAAIPEGVGWTQLTGNEVGVLLGHELLTRAIAQGAAPETLLVALSIVSSPLLPRIAHALGAECAETLTGFKWIANRAMDVQRERGLRFVFGYEEALGYSVGELVRDKDGVSAAYALAGLAARLKSQGLTLRDRLDEIARTYGLFVSGQHAVTAPGAEGRAAIDAAMRSFRADPPWSLFGRSVLEVTDYQSGLRTRATGETAPTGLPPSDVLSFALDGGSRVMLRPSGTEPKIKYYFDLRVEVQAQLSMELNLAAARRELDACIVAFREGCQARGVVGG